MSDRAGAALKLSDDIQIFGGDGALCAVAGLCAGDAPATPAALNGSSCAADLIKSPATSLLLQSASVPRADDPTSLRPTPAELARRHRGAEITGVPGFDAPLPSRHYGGYVTVDKKRGRHLYYYFVTSEGSPGTDPVVLWLNGGPGCSSFDGARRRRRRRKLLPPLMCAWPGACAVLPAPLCPNPGPMRELSVCLPACLGRRVCERARTLPLRVRGGQGRAREAAAGAAAVGEPLQLEQGGQHAVRRFAGRGWHVVLW